ncbi:PREDICTED: uncharacterized protein K02A2.6-like, partial [Rhagoletis zephyria]|uniref:uncharacterized protein K02A2.6-like n=1 Tax=Rhagoletis zephyria TaxID=28612 RepID=UPI0008119933
MTLHRLQRWAILLQAYDYKIRYKKSSENANADVLSKLPAGEDKYFDESEKKMLDVDIIYNTAIQECPLGAKCVADAMKNDDVLQHVSKYIVSGWPANREVPGNIKPFINRKLCLSLQSGIILLQTDYTRIVIPKQLQSKVLTLLHEGHWGKERMKQLARRYVWFPGIDKQIENVHATCAICQASANLPKQEYSPWPEPSGPWERLHLDFAGPYFNRMWLIVVDAYSKFPYTIELAAATTMTTIAAAT